MDVRTKAQAEALSDIPYVRIAIGEGRQRPFEIGDTVVLRPCVTEESDLAEYRKEHERGERAYPCPRVELEPENAEAIELFWLAVNEEAGRYASVMADALLGGLSVDGRLQVLRRVTRALGDEKVCAARRKLDKDAAAKARMQR